MFLTRLVCFLFFFAASAQQFPKLTLPWGTWQATKYDALGDFFTFENVRFGKAPLGDLRFNAPIYPDNITDPTTPQNSSYGPICVQVDATQECTPGGNLAQRPPGCSPKPVGEQSEDCLFLDLYVPATVFTDGTTDLPVVVWIYGGAYVFGAKNQFKNVNFPLYNGTGMLHAAKSSSSPMIFVAGNYRLGAFGWLAGEYMEGLAHDHAAVPNAGIYDQRLVFQWVQDYIHLVGGDKRNVSTWGESAGAGSILHHLVAEGGTRDPLFRKAILQSPAFEWLWDRTGTMNTVYNNFSRIAGCPDFDVDCLKSRSTQNLSDTNQLFFETGTRCTQLYPLGPAMDGILFEELPVIAFNQGRYWKGIDSLIISHTANESGTFIPPYVVTEHDFEYFLDMFLPESKSQGVLDARAAIRARYPAQGAPYYGDQRARVADVIRDSTFTCNTRQLHDAYAGASGTYMLQYDFLSVENYALHASDLLPAFWNNDVNMTFFFRHCANLTADETAILTDFFDEYAQQYQTYFVRHAINGNPNRPSDHWWQYWSNATTHDDKAGTLGSVMETQALPGDYFNVYSTDRVNTHATCNFWLQAAENITRDNVGRPPDKIFQETKQQVLISKHDL